MGRSNFYTPGLWGGGKNPGYQADQFWNRTPFVTDFLDPEIPQGVYTSFLTKQGLGGQDRRSQWARSMYGQTQSGYQAALRENPALSYLDYLNMQFGSTGLNNIWLGMSPEQRGERPGLFVPQTRLIPWG